MMCLSDLIGRPQILSSPLPLLPPHQVLSPSPFDPPPRRTPSAPRRVARPPRPSPRTLHTLARTMARRPTSSAGGSRPFTSSGLQPASPPVFNNGHYPHDNTYVEEDEEDESDAEDLFAFLPPSTADQQRDAQKRSQDLLHSTPPYPPPFAHALPLDVPFVSFPSPTFDPYARFPADAAGPSSLFSPPISNIPVDSPPSTMSQHAASDPYRMRKLSTARAPTTDTRPSRASAISSREIHVDLLSSPPEKTLEVDPHHSSRRKWIPSSSMADDTATLDLTPSMLEEDSRDGSIKCVASLPSFFFPHNYT